LSPESSPEEGPGATPGDAPDPAPPADGPWSRRPSRWRSRASAALPFVLFALTVCSTLVAGGFAADSGIDLDPTDGSALARHLRAGLPFAATLLGILLAHELGHFFTARAFRVDASLPYFIPFPSLLGTLGAVIRMRGPIPSRRALVAIGASGPVAGFVVAVPLMFLGLRLSVVQPVPLPSGWLPSQSILVMALRWAHGLPVLDGVDHGILLEGPSLAYLAAKRFALGPIPAGSDVILHPVALAAWFGLFVTALNLLPVGQLDGGHVLYALLGGRARNVGRAVVAVLTLLGLAAWPGWLLWALLAGKVVRTTHPPVLRPDEPLGGWPAALAWAALALFLMTFVPVPLQEM